MGTTESNDPLVPVSGHTDPCWVRYQSDLSISADGDFEVNLLGVVVAKEIVAVHPDVKVTVDGGIRCEAIAEDVMLWPKTVLILEVQVANALLHDVDSGEGESRGGNSRCARGARYRNHPWIQVHWTKNSVLNRNRILFGAASP